jgi:hypothetical protein
VSVWGVSSKFVTAYWCRCRGDSEFYKSSQRLSLRRSDDVANNKRALKIAIAANSTKYVTLIDSLNVNKSSLRIIIRYLCYF